MNDALSDPHLVARLQTLSRAAAIVVITVGTLVVVGWVFNIEILKSVLHGLATMKFNTALCFVLLGIGLLRLHIQPRVTQLMVALALILVLLTISQYVFGWDLGIDQWLVRDAAASPVYPGRMAEITAVNFLGVGSALLLISTRRYTLAHLFALLIGFFALVAFVGYLYNVESLYRIGSFSSIALHTAILFIVLCLGVLVAYPAEGVATYLSTNSAGGYMVRRLVPTAVLVPLTVGWLRWQGEKLGLYNEAFGLGLFAVSTVFIINALLLWIAPRMHKLDIERQAALAALRQSHDELETKVQERTRELYETNQSLAEQRNLLRTVIDNLPSPIYVKDTESHFLLVNQAVLDVLGVESEQALIGKTDFDLHQREFAEQYYADEQEILTSGQSKLNYEEKIFDKARGTMRILSSNKIPLRNAQGEILGLVGISIDISEAKQKAAEIAYQANLLANVNDAILATDCEGKITYWNRAAERIYGWTGEEILGKVARDVLHAELTEAQRADILKQVSKMNNLQLEVVHQCKNGTSIYIEATSMPLRDENGQKVGFVSVNRDVTERHHTESRFRGLLESAPDAMVIVDGDGKIVLINSQTKKLFGYAENELIGQSVETLIPQRFLRHHPEHRTDYFADPRVRSMGAGLELYARRKDGSEFPVEISLSPLETESGLLVSSAIRDITERKTAEKQALELEKERERAKMLTDFIRDVSHDFRTPLTIITTASYLLSKANDPEKRAVQFQKVERQIGRLTDLLDRLITIGRLDGETTSHKRPFDVNQLMVNFCANLDHDAQSKSITVQSSLWKSPLIVQVDVDELRSALAELSKNAITYTPEQGTITIRTRQENNQAIIEVSDTGIGILHEDLSLIFQRLYRVDKARGQESGGSGLGLSIAKRIIELHHGEIVAESIVGEGTTIRVTLPLNS